MIPLSIRGIGLISAHGRGLEKFAAAIRENKMPQPICVNGRNAYRVASEDLTDREILKNAKRADRFCKLTVLAAYDALKDSGLAPEAKQSMGVIVATAHGAHSSIFKFLDGIIDYGEGQVSPTTFAHSIHNAAAAYVASALQTRGPVMTITQFHSAFHQAVLLAASWLAEKRTEHVLVGIADECSPTMEYIWEERLRRKPDALPGEGSAFFVLSADPSAARYGVISGVRFSRGNQAWDGVPLLKTSFTGTYAGFLSGGAFETAASVLLPENETGCEGQDFDKINAVQCVSDFDGAGQAFIKIEKAPMGKQGE